MSSHDHTVAEGHDHSHDTVGPAARKRLWMVFWILLGITIFEVAIAFSPLNKEVLQWTFIALTIVKAYYIVFFFMHMKHEHVNMKYSIVVPFVVLIVYFIYMMMTEGNLINGYHQIFDKNI